MARECPRIGDALESLTGVLFFTSGAFKVEPRTTADISGEVIPSYALLGTVVTMDDGLSVLQDAYVIIRGDRIVAIQQAEPPGVPIVDCEGLIFPGLIDAHNHAVWNILDLIPFNRTFNDRSEWRAHPLYADFQTQYYAMRNYGGSDAQTSNAYKLAEVRALCAGTTMIQSTNCNGPAYDYFAHQGIGIGNAERFPSRVFDSVFPLNETQAFWTQKRGEYWERFVIHLSEGINAGALQEFYTWRDWGMLDGRTTILHGVPYGPSEWTQMAAAGASLVWAPASNWYLYAASPNIPQALAAGVNVAIAPDWTESGCRDMLAEMKYGYALNVSLWGGMLTAEDFALFATRNAAQAMGLHERTGKLAPGFQADCLVIPGDPQSPYDALLAADPADVRLTVVSGRPMYGDQELMTQFPFLESMEEIEVCGREKMLAVQVDAFAIPGSDKAMSLVISELEEAYGHALPRVCAFLGPYYCSAAGADDLADAGGPSLTVWPNPSRGSATLKLGGLGGGPARLEIYDGRGGIVRGLLMGTRGAADRLAVWDGRDEAGRRVASGVYFVRLDGGTRAAGAKIQMIR